MPVRPQVFSEFLRLFSQTPGFRSVILRRIRFIRPSPLSSLDRMSPSTLLLAIYCQVLGDFSLTFLSCPFLSPPPFPGRLNDLHTRLFDRAFPLLRPLRIFLSKPVFPFPFSGLSSRMYPGSGSFGADVYFLPLLLFPPFELTTTRRHSLSLGLFDILIS